MSSSCSIRPRDIWPGRKHFLNRLALRLLKGSQQTERRVPTEAFGRAEVERDDFSPPTPRSAASVRCQRLDEGCNLLGREEAVLVKWACISPALAGNL